VLNCTQEAKQLIEKYGLPSPSHYELVIILHDVTIWQRAEGALPNCGIITRIIIIMLARFFDRIATPA